MIDGRYHGLGIACFIEGGGSGPKENARLAIAPDGTIVVHVGSSAVGQGIETIMAQIAADALELPLDRIKVLHGSTTLLPDGVGAFGSRSTVMGGSAIVIAANALIEQFRAAGRAALRRRAGKPQDRGGRRGGARWPQACARSTLRGSIADGMFFNSKATYTYGTAIAHVAVDPRTGKVDVLDLVLVDDVGRIVNPLTLHGQVEGAAVQGLGSVLSEEISYDENGQLLVGSLADYMIPLATDVPHLTAISLEEHPSPNNPLGVKGAGEGGIIPIGGAIAGAVASALSSLGSRTQYLAADPITRVAIDRGCARAAYSALMFASRMTRPYSSNRLRM